MGRSVEIIIIIIFSILPSVFPFSLFKLPFYILCIACFLRNSNFIIGLKWLSTETYIKFTTIRNPYMASKME